VTRSKLRLDTHYLNPPRLAVLPKIGKLGFKVSSGGDYDDLDYSNPPLQGDILRHSFSWLLSLFQENTA
jgi:hypothetical protein